MILKRNFPVDDKEKISFTYGGGSTILGIKIKENTHAEPKYKADNHGDEIYKN